MAADVLVTCLCLALNPPVSAAGAASYLAVTVVCLTWFGTYRARLTWSVLDDLPALLSVVACSALAEQLVPALFGEPLSARGLAVRLMFAAVLVSVGRAVACWAVREAGRRGHIAQPALILGAGVVGRQLAEALLRQSEYGLVPIGHLDEDESPDTDPPFPVPRLGGYHDLADCIRRENVRTALVAYDRTETQDTIAAARHDPVLVDALRTCDRLDCEIYCVPRFYELHHRSRDMDEVWGVSLVRVRRAAWRSAAWRVKRALDVVTALAMLVLLSPLLLVISVAVLVEVGPDVLFKQVRVGLDGRPFTLLKFRTVRLPETSDAGPVWSVVGNASVGRVGQLLRSTSLDELPQLVNVLRGQMSIVGPRPERVHFVEEFTRMVPGYGGRHRIPAGLTGWAQVNGLRGDTSIEERARFDNYYIQNWSLWLDLKIIVRTVASVLLGRGS